MLTTQKSCDLWDFQHQKKSNWFDSLLTVRKHFDGVAFLTISHHGRPVNIPEVIVIIISPISRGGWIDCILAWLVIRSKGNLRWGSWGRDRLQIVTLTSLTPTYHTIFAKWPNKINFVFLASVMGTLWNLYADLLRVHGVCINKVNILKYSL